MKNSEKAAHGREQTSSVRQSRTESQLTLFCVYWLCFFLIRPVGCWIALSNQGYSVKHSLLAQAGVRVTGDVKVNGMLLSTPVADLQCNPSRKGALRWNEQAFEGCDGVSDWRPLTFCSRSCDIDTATVPCGIRVRNTCDGACRQNGTGLNMRQCLLNVADTPCDDPVEDLCGNICGLSGEMGCADSVKAVGDYTIRPTGGLVNSPATYTFSVAKRGLSGGQPDDGFYLTYRNSDTGETVELTRISALVEEEKREDPENSVPFGNYAGMELGQPLRDEDSTVRISMYTEFVGGYIKMGQDFNSEAPSHIFVDGTIEKECPFLFNAGNYDSPLFMKVCLEPPTQNVSITLPDAGGVVLTTGNEEDIRSIPGLRGEDPLQFTGANKDKFHLRRPGPPRVTCSNVNCQDAPLVDEKDTTIGGCNALPYENSGMDLFRIIYGLVDVSQPDANFSVSAATRARLLNATQVGKRGPLVNVTVIRPVVVDVNNSHANASDTNASLALNASGVNASEANGSVTVGYRTEQTWINYTNLELAMLFAEWEVMEYGNQTDRLLLLWAGQLDSFEYSYQVLDRIEYQDRWDSNLSNWTNVSVSLYLNRTVNTSRFAADFLRQREECFACCCSRFSFTQADGLPFRADPGGLGLEELGRCPGQRTTQPTFCLAGERIGEPCLDDAECGNEVNCGYDENIVACFEEDLGMRCQVVWDRPNLTTTVNFVSPKGYRRMTVPDASGSIISTGNLKDITSIGVQEVPIVGRSGPSTTTTIAFMPSHAADLQQQRTEAVNNTLLVPSEADGVVLSTANLDDVTLDAGSVTGLRIEQDLHVQGSLVFGDDVQSSGFFLPPVPSSVHYSTPHSGRPSSRGRPGQLSFLVNESTTVLEFEPSNALNGSNSSYVSLPATNGTVISTGNLEAVTAQSGMVTSLDVMELSHLQGGVVAGVKGDAQVSVQGRASHTIVFNASHPRGRGEQGFSNTVVGFDMLQGRRANIDLPATSGVVVTTGNLPDVFAFTGNSMDVSGRSLLHGSVSMGTRTSDFPDTAIQIDGYLAGDIVYREPPAESGSLSRVPFPNTWDVHPESVCREQFAANTNPQTSIPVARLSVTGSAQHVQRALSVPDGVPPFGTGCREVCEATPGCGAMVASKYFRVSLVATTALGEPDQMVGVSMPAPRVESGMVVGDDTCYAGYAAAPMNLTSDFAHNFTSYPASKQSFIDHTVCQAAVTVSRAEAEALWPTEWYDLGQLEIRLVGCDRDGSMCDDLEECARPDAKCNVTIRSHAVGSFLGGSNESACVGQEGQVGCAQWTDAPSMWNLEPYAGDPAGKLFRLKRAAACVEVIPGLTTSVDVYDELTCGEGDVMTDVMVKWGTISGTCGGYGVDGGTECVGPDDLIASICLPNGCDIRILARELYVRAKGGDGTWHWQRLRQCAVGERLVIQSTCQTTPYLSSDPPSDGGALRMVPEAVVSDDDTATVFNLQSRIVLHTGEEHTLQNRYLRDCWVTERSPQQCSPSSNREFDLHVYSRYSSTTLAFANMSSEQHQTFPDATGKIISSGNLRDVTRLEGLQSQDTFIYQHSHQPGGPVTIVDFAQVGHAERDRLDGLLPDYEREDGSPGHTVPNSGNRRITFPDATGTVITTGNLDDLVFQRLELNGLTLDGTANFFNELGQTAVLNFRNSSRISGCLNFNRQPARDPETSQLILDEMYTQVCIEEPTGVNKINLPDASGTILTTGNLLNLPTVGVQGELFVGGDATIEGDMRWGREGVDAVVQQFSWIDGDVGVTFRAPESIQNEGFDVVNLNMPHMGGIDIAIRHYLTFDVRELAVDVQGGEAYLEPVAGTERINETVCERVMAENQVYDYHGLGYFLLKNELVAKTLIRDGTPYWGVEMQGNQTYPACVLIESGGLVCEGPRPDPCSCLNTERDVMVVRWRAVGVQAALGEQRNASCANVACDDSPFTCAAPDDPGCAFDGDVSSIFRSRDESVASAVPHVEVQPQVESFQAYGTNLRDPSLAIEGQCVLGLMLAAPTEITRVRVFPASGQAASLVGGKVQGSIDPNATSWVDILVFTVAPLDDEWSEIVVRGQDGVQFTAVRYVGASCAVGAGCRCDVAEWEFHRGRVTQRFTALQAGTRSHFVVAEAVDRHPPGAMVLKCAAAHWFPAHQTMHVNELMLPEASGVLLTTGNLQDVTKEVGTISSLQVAGQAEIRGSTVLGSAQQDTLLKIAAVTMGRTPLSFAGGGIVDAAAFLSLPDASADRNVIFPPDGTGTIVTTGSLPLLTEHISVVGDASLRGSVLMDSDVIIGNTLSSSSLHINSALSGSFPITFRPNSVKANEKTTLGVENPSKARSINLPDVSGTILTTGNLPDVFESPVFVGESIFSGGAKFHGGETTVGAPDSETTLEINSALAGSQPLKFEGRSTDDRTLSLAVEEPSAQHMLFLPDVSGTVITSGNFPDVFESLQVLGELLLEGDATIAGSSTVVGHCQLKTQLSIHSYLRGRYPLVFSPTGGTDADADDDFLSTTFEITPPTGDNVIAFPDASGTVITTGNIPTAVSVDFEYSVNVGRFLALSSSVTLGRGATEPEHPGTFVFADASPPPASGAFSSTRNNSFNVRATGGVRFVTGYTTSGRELGVVLESGSSAWSVLSDQGSKTVLASLDHVDTLRTLVDKVPVSTWSYDGDDEGVRHMGPMAQDVFAAFGTGSSPERISTVDMDGIALSAAKGVQALLDDAEQAVASVGGVIDDVDREIAAAASKQAELDAMADESARSLDLLEHLLFGVRALPL